MLNFDVGKVTEKIREKLEDLRRFEEENREVIDLYSSRFGEMLSQGPLALAGDLEQVPSAAVPVEPQWFFRSGVSFDTQENMLEWAQDKIGGVGICGIDGSEIPASRLVSLPVALARAYGLVNFHDQQWRYLDEYDLVTPVDSHGRGADRFRLNEFELSFRMFSLECRLVGEVMKFNPDLVLFDNPLIMSYLMRNRSSQYTEYHISALISALEECRARKVPLVGIVDNSAAKDITTGIKGLYGDSLGNYEPIPDALVVGSHLQLFDRTCAYRARREVLTYYRTEIEGQVVHYEEQVYFCYVRTHSHRPLRLEFPGWVLDSGLLDNVVEYICASSILGEGYPYELARAHDKVTLRMGDRDRFMRILVGEARQRGFDIKFGIKSLKKKNRIR
ncbi:MAG: DNA double-strand break repair nuclease NurA [Promethearchaeota archaeon]